MTLSKIFLWFMRIRAMKSSKSTRNQGNIQCLRLSCLEFRWWVISFIGEMQSTLLQPNYATGINFMREKKRSGTIRDSLLLTARYQWCKGSSFHRWESFVEKEKRGKAWVRKKCWTLLWLVECLLCWGKRKRNVRKCLQDDIEHIENESPDLTCSVKDA